MGAFVDILSRKKIQLVLSNALAILAVSGCQSPAAMADSQSSSQSPAKMIPSQQLIIKLKSNACDAAEIAHLSSATRVPLEYIRTLTEGTCVIRQMTGETNDFLRGQELLRQHPAVEWLELDAIMKAL